MISRYDNSVAKGFTLIEIIVVIAVMSILSTIMIVSYSSWQRTSYAGTVKSDLLNAVTAMENARNFGSGYPSSLSGIYSASSGVEITVASADSKSFCIEAHSSKDNTVEYYIDSQTNKSEPQSGACASPPSVLAGPMIWAAANFSDPEISINWEYVSGATGYKLEKASNASFSDTEEIATFGATASRPYISSGLLPAKKYYYRMRAFNASGSGVWSETVSATTGVSIAVPSVPVVTANTVSSTTTYSWPSVSCSTGQNVRYQYQYTINPASYNSGWVAYGNSLSIAFTTSTEGQDYVLAVKAQCYSADGSSLFSTSGSATYHRPGTWKAMSATCGIASDDNAYCWGINSQYGSVGDGTLIDRWVPTPVSRAGVLAGKSVKVISSDYNGACVIATDNQTYCWGRNTEGEIGNNTSGNNILIPTSPTTSGVLSGKTIKQVGANTIYAHCVIASDNYPYCWGMNTSGQIGDNTVVSKYVPTTVYRTGVLNGLTVKAISTGRNHACVIASDNLLYCWGDGADGKLGRNSTTDTSVAVAPTTTGVLSGKTILKVSAGFSNTCVIASDNKPYCWGDNTYGQVGDNTSGTDRLVPTAVLMTGALNGLTVKEISTGNYKTCVIASNDKAYCWGSNANGGIGDNTSGTNRLAPTAVYTSGVLSGLTIKDIQSGNWSDVTYALASDNNIYAWGYGANGLLGNNNNVNSIVPVQVSAPF